MSFKLQIVQEIERGQLTVTESTKTYGIQNRSTVVKWLRKFGNFDWEKTPFTMSKSPEQKIMELEAKVKLLENRSPLERQAFVADKSNHFDMMIDIAREYKIDIRKTLPNNRPF
jgi:transposase-like protein